MPEFSEVNAEIATRRESGDSEPSDTEDVDGADEEPGGERDDDGELGGEDDQEALGSYRGATIRGKQVCYLIDGFVAQEASLRYAGVLGWRPVDLVGMSLRIMWPLYAGKMQSIRQQVLWQASVILPEKSFSPRAFIRTGSCVGAAKRQWTTKNQEMREKVEAFQGCINRGLPEPDFDSPTWREDVAAAFEARDKELGMLETSDEQS